jgi:hypothetical protein
MITPRTQRVALVVLCTVVAACSGLPPAYESTSKRQYQNAVDGYVPPGGEAGAPGEAGHAGQDFCRDVATSARNRALDNSRLGWTFGIASLGAAGAGTVLTATADSPSETRKGIDAGLPILAGILGVVAVAYFTREKAADVLAGTATKSTTLDDETAATTCNTALADWENSRANANDSLIEKIQAQKASVDNLKDQVDAGQKKIDSLNGEVDAGAQEKAKLQQENTKLRQLLPAER